MGSVRTWPVRDIYAIASPEMTRLPLSGGPYIVTVLISMAVAVRILNFLDSQFGNEWAGQHLRQIHIKGWTKNMVDWLSCPAAYASIASVAGFGRISEAGLTEGVGSLRVSA